MDNYLKYFKNPYELNYSYKNQKVDYYGYLAYKLTEFKEENILTHDLNLRSIGVLVSCMISLKLSQKFFRKIILFGATFFSSSLILAPELINPYYNNNFNRNRLYNDILEYLKTNNLIN